MNEEAQRIDLNDYVQTGEGGTSLTYAHKTRPTMAKLFNLANEDDMAEREFLTVPPDTLKAHWSVFIAAYLGTDDQAVIGQYTRRLMAYYAVRLPYMLDLLVQGRLPEDALQQLPKVIG